MTQPQSVTTLPEPGFSGLRRAVSGELADLTVEEHCAMSAELMALSRRKPSRHVVETREGVTRAWTDDSASRVERLAIEARYRSVAERRRELEALAPAAAPAQVAERRRSEAAHFERLRSAMFGEFAALTMAQHLRMASERLALVFDKPSRQRVERKNGATHAWSDDRASRAESLAIDRKYRAIAKANR